MTAGRLARSTISGLVTGQAQQQLTKPRISKLSVGKIQKKQSVILEFFWTGGRIRLLETSGESGDT
jgi:hypothetical protein